MKPPRIVIVGGGPAGMVLAYQLASNGVPVRVLERHPDFAREFRGELLQASVVEALQRSGLFSALLERGLALPDIERQMYVGKRRTVRVPGPRERGAVVSQPGMLALLHELCSRYPHYQLDFGTTVLDAIQENGRVVAMKTRHNGVEGRVDGDLFVICNGRNSHLRKSCGCTSPTASRATSTGCARTSRSCAGACCPHCRRRSGPTWSASSTRRPSGRC